MTDEYHTFDRQTDRQTEKKIRFSSIELLKIFAIVLIAISHTTQSLDTGSAFSSKEILCGYPQSLVTKDIQQFILSCFRYFGCIGNEIFWVCSAWFLVDNSKVNKKKIVDMLADIWTISIVILLIYVFILHGSIQQFHIREFLFPSTYSLNWYLTCYMLMYAFHPILNMFVNNFLKKGCCDILLY